MIRINVARSVDHSRTTYFECLQIWRFSIEVVIYDWEDAGWSFTLPAEATQTQRSWRPEVPGINRFRGMQDYTGRFLDG